MHWREQLFRKDGDRLPLIALGVSVILFLAAIGGVGVGNSLLGRVRHLDETGIREQGRVTRAHQERKGSGSRSNTHYYIELSRDDGAKKEFTVSQKEFSAWGRNGVVLPLITDPDDRDYWVPEYCLPQEYAKAWITILATPCTALFTIAMIFMGLWYQYWRKRPGTGTRGAAYGSQTPYTSQLRR